mgnify:CR=1 FL=1
MADEKALQSEGYTRGGIAFVGGMAFFLVGLAAKLALLNARKAQS